MHTPSADPVALGVVDFGLPEIPELPGGTLHLEDVLLWPGVNALFDRAGRPIPETCLRRGVPLDHFPHGRPEPLSPRDGERAASAEALERIVYLPYARMVHFGHLLTEFAAHVGPLLEHPRGLDGFGGERSVLVVSGRCQSSVPHLADLLGLPAHRVLSTADLSAPAQARVAIVPRPSMINRHGLAVRHFGHVQRVLDRLHGIGPLRAALAGARGHEKLYLSRSRLPAGSRQVLQEEILEGELERLGWRVVHPQELSVADQFERLAAARTVAGCVGSALHLLMAFGEHAGGRRLIALGSSVERTNPNVVLQAARQGMPFRHVVCLEPDSDGGDGGPRGQGLRFTTSPSRVARCVEAIAAGPFA